MAKTEKYFVGPTLLGEIRETITRVAGMPNRTSGASLPVRLQELPRRGGSSVRLVSFVPPWSKGQEKTITFIETTATATAMNVFGTVIGGCGTAHAAVFSQGGTWFLLAAECP